MTVEEVMGEILQDRRFYENSGGGVTISGGEPGLNAAFVRAILGRCKQEGIHTAFETCGYCSWTALESLLPVTDLVMMDLKLMTPEKHQQATGNTNERILANARMLAMTSKPIIFRTPIVPTVNDTVEEVRSDRRVHQGTPGTADGERTGGEHANISYELLAFHKLGSDKYRSLDLEYQASPLEVAHRRADARAPGDRNERRSGGTNTLGPRHRGGNGPQKGHLSMEVATAKELSYLSASSEFAPRRCGIPRRSGVTSGSWIWMITA